MITIDAKGMQFRTLNEKLHEAQEKEVLITSCMGQRYLANGLKDKYVKVRGIPGNALGAYMDGATVELEQNAQDATGDTMNDGRIIVHGSAGDATGYSMRGGKIYVRGNTGYRCGVHMKAFAEKRPLIVVGGRAGSFLGEYQAGGEIYVLGLNSEGKSPVGYFCGTGIHGGAIYLRTKELPRDLPKQVAARVADDKDKAHIAKQLKEYCEIFNLDLDEILAHDFFVITADTANPYKQMYTH